MIHQPGVLPGCHDIKILEKLRKTWRIVQTISLDWTDQLLVVRLQGRRDDVRKFPGDAGAEEILKFIKWS